MCSWGPVLLGHQHPEVEEAVARQAALGDCLDGPSERMVELSERLVDIVAHADWAMFQKKRTDATTLCCTIARAATGKRKILVAKGAYHGAHRGARPLRPVRRPKIARTSFTTRTTTSRASAKRSPTTSRQFWFRRFDTTPASTKSWSIRRSRAGFVNSATPRERH